MALGNLGQHLAARVDLTANCRFFSYYVDS